ncbi:MAG: hypothetical protein BWX86_01909 [Verrucomicrobia bacterium ADurb.Bin122]|nr:MAG: hypothetical protein BWX86_01909 [Verrucomicrobia bacterium ADurb.Bin122]
MGPAVKRSRVTRHGGRVARAPRRLKRSGRVALFWCYVKSVYAEASSVSDLLNTSEGDFEESVNCANHWLIYVCKERLKRQTALFWGWRVVRMVVCPTGDTCPRLPTQEPDALTIPRPIVCHVPRALAARLPRFAHERRLSIERSVHVPVLARPALRRAACGARREWCAGVAATGQPLGGQHRGQRRHRCQRRRDQQHDLRHGRAQRRRPQRSIREVRSARHHEELLG